MIWEPVNVNDRIESLSQIFTDSELVLRAMRAAVREALRDHKRAGNSVAIRRDGRSIVIPPEEIELTDEPDEGSS